MVYFGLLGPLLVQDDAGRTLSIRATRQRTVLAALLLHANRTVTADTLCDILWAGQKPPPRHHAALLNYLSRLRRDLGPGMRKRIETRPLGYAILIGDDTELDLRLLASLEERADAAMAAGDWAKARHYAEQALTLWRDEPLCDVPRHGCIRRSYRGWPRRGYGWPRPPPRRIFRPDGTTSRQVGSGSWYGRTRCGSDCTSG